MGHLCSAFPTWASVRPNEPAWVDDLDLGGLEAFVFAIVPLSHIFCDNVGRKLVEMVEEKVERLVGPLPGGNEDCAKVCRIEKL